MSNFRIKVEPVGADRFEISITNEDGAERHRLRGPANNGYTEDDLRAAEGLPKCGLSQEQIEETIASANARRAP